MDKVVGEREGVGVNSGGHLYSDQRKRRGSLLSRTRLRGVVSSCVLPRMIVFVVLHTCQHRKREIYQ